MSGGFFNYGQYKLGSIAESIDQVIKENNENDWRNYNAETIAIMKAASELLQVARIYVDRIDWLVSGDDSEETFHKRLEEDLNHFVSAGDSNE